MNDYFMPQNFWRFPIITVPSLMEDVDELLPTNNFFNGLSVFEDNKNVYVEASVPGIDPKEVEVTFDKGVLTIKAGKKEEEKGKKYYRKATKFFFYRIAPADLDPKAKPQAVCKNGVMTVTFAKAPVTKPQRIAVKTA